MDGANNIFDLDLGDGHFLRWTPFPDADDRRSGAILYHPDLTKVQKWCSSGIVWENLPGDTGPVWKLHGRADAKMTVSPSIRCLRCGDHGFIQKGRWVRA